MMNCKYIGENIGTIKSRLFRARKHLRQIYQNIQPIFFLIRGTNVIKIYETRRA